VAIGDVGVRMLHMKLRSPFEGVVAAALLLAGCEFPSKVGDLETPGESSGEETGRQPATTTTSSGSSGVDGSTTSTGSGAVDGSTTSTSSGAVDESTTSTSASEGGADCEGLAEVDCEGTPGCKPIRGNPHTLGGGGTCVADEFVFLACAVDSGACPPFIPTVCPVGETEPRFDVPSGCIPPGFETCEGAGSPPCP